MTLDHIIYTARGTYNNMYPWFQYSLVFANISATDGCVTFHAHIIAQRKHNFLYLLWSIFRQINKKKPVFCV